jgi:hypothetical protein
MKGSPVRVRASASIYERDRGAPLDTQEPQVGDASVRAEVPAGLAAGLIRSPSAEAGARTRPARPARDRTCQRGLDPRRLVAAEAAALGVGVRTSRRRGTDPGQLGQGRPRPPRPRRRQAPEPRAAHIVLARRRTDAETIASIARRVSEGKGEREAVRCLKRYLARPSSDSRRRRHRLDAYRSIPGTATMVSDAPLEPTERGLVPKGRAGSSSTRMRRPGTSARVAGSTASSRGSRVTTRTSRSSGSTSRFSGRASPWGCTTGRPH